MSEPQASSVARGEATEHDRERIVSRTFVELADTLVDDFDVLEFLRRLTERCTELLGVSAAAVILSDERGGLRVAATSSERSELLEMFAVQTEQGPCIDCVRSGEPVASTDLRGDADRWPRFSAAAGECGFDSMLALPMRLRRTVVGALSLLDGRPDGIDEHDAQLGQALANVATISILQQRAIHRSDLLSEQLQTALNSRIVIEQAKGVLAERGTDLDMAAAFTKLRDYARSHGLRLATLAKSVVNGTIDTDPILRPAPKHRP